MSMHVNRPDDIWKEQFSGGNIMWSEMGKQNTQDKKVYRLLRINLSETKINLDIILTCNKYTKLRWCWS